MFPSLSELRLRAIEHLAGKSSVLVNVILDNRTREVIVSGDAVMINCTAIDDKTSESLWPLVKANELLYQAMRKCE